MFIHEVAVARRERRDFSILNQGGLHCPFLLNVKLESCEYQFYGPTGNQIRVNRSSIADDVSNRPLLVLLQKQFIEQS